MRIGIVLLICVAACAGFVGCAGGAPSAPLAGMFVDYSCRYADNPPTYYLGGTTKDTPGAQKIIVVVPINLRVIKVEGKPVQIGEDFDGKKLVVPPGTRKFTVEHKLWGAGSPVALESNLQAGVLYDISFRLVTDALNRPKHYAVTVVTKGNLNP